MKNAFALSEQLVPEIDPRVAQMSQRAQSLLSSPWVSRQPTQEAPLPAAQAGSVSAQDITYSGYDPSQAQRFGANGFAENVPRSLIGTESGGNWGAENGEVGAGGSIGHFGILQFGEARLQDAKNNGVIPQDMTPQQFKASQQAQVAVSNWHFNDIDSNIRKNGYDKMVGQSVGGVPISMNGMRSMAHLGGFGGLSKFIKSQGQYNPADSFGTSLSAYGKTHS